MDDSSGSTIASSNSCSSSREKGGGGAILHCIWSLGRGGAERQLSYLAPELARMGWVVHVAFAFGGPYESDLRASGVTLHDLAASSRRDFGVAIRLHRLVRSLRPAVIQTWLTQMDIIAGAIGLLGGIPRVLSERSMANAYPPSLLHAIRLAIGRRANVVVANSEGGLEYWRRYRDSGNVLAPNGLPLREFFSKSDSASDSRSGSSLIFVGRLSREKNPGALVSALATEGMGSYEAVLCGAGPLESELRELIRTEMLTDRVRLLGEVDDVWARMKSAAAMVAPSMFEGNPNAVLEGAACGVPLVVSDIPAHRRVLGAESAVFVDPSDPISVAEGIRAAVSSSASDRVRNARRDVAELDVGSMAARYDQVYRALVSGER